jgi:ClpP class serine protease
MACSAAYWLASQAQSIMMDQSALVGSIGVYLPIADQSERYKQAGVKMDVIKGGKFKGMGIPGTTLTEEQRAQLQSRVDYIYGQFKAAVRTGRGMDIRDEDMQGQDFFGAQAMEAGLVDAIASLDETVAQVKQYITK